MERQVFESKFKDMIKNRKVELEKDGTVSIYFSYPSTIYELQPRWIWYSVSESLISFHYYFSAIERMNGWHEAIQAELLTIERQIPATLFHLFSNPPLADDIRQYIQQCIQQYIV